MVSAAESSYARGTVVIDDITMDGVSEPNDDRYLDELTLLRIENERLKERIDAIGALLKETFKKVNKLEELAEKVAELEKGMQMQIPIEEMQALQRPDKAKDDEIMYDSHVELYGESVADTLRFSRKHGFVTVTELKRMKIVEFKNNYGYTRFMKKLGEIEGYRCHKNESGKWCISPK